MALSNKIHIRRPSDDRRNERTAYPQSKSSPTSKNSGHPSQKRRSSRFSISSIASLLQPSRPLSTETHHGDATALAADPWLAVPSGIYNHPRAFDPYPPTYHDCARPESRTMGSKASKQAKQAEQPAAATLVKSEYAARPKTTAGGQTWTGGAAAAYANEMTVTNWVYGAEGKPTGKKTKKLKK